MATDDVIHITCIDLEGKLMCFNKVACFYDNKFSTSNLFSEITHGNIDATVITQQPKICCWLSGTNSMAEPDACPMHQRGPCTSAPVIYKALPHTCTALALQIVQHQHSNKWLYQHAKL